jgi:hypothetical protein
MTQEQQLALSLEERIAQHREYEWRLIERNETLDAQVWLYKWGYRAIVATVWILIAVMMWRRGV